LLKKIDSVDHIHVNTLFPFGIFALHLKWFKKIPFIISEHWTGYHIPQSKDISFFERFISTVITKNATFVCPVSNSLKNAMLHLGLKGNYVPVPNVVNTELFSPIDEKERQFTIVHVSSMKDLHKNISGMLRVARQLETEIGSFTWKFIGGSSDQFKPLIEQLNFKQATIQFINHISQKELALHLQTAHLCVSFSNYETFGIAMTEAISCGTPVISTNTGILSELDSESFFMIIPVKNEPALLKELLAHHREPCVEDTTKMHGYIHKKFSDTIIAKTFSKLYLKSLKLPS
jgi:glycosyltransferase involved in cell wall biosynthesis